MHKCQAGARTKLHTTASSAKAWINLSSRRRQRRAWQFVYLELVQSACCIDSTAAVQHAADRCEPEAASCSWHGVEALPCIQSRIIHLKLADIACCCISCRTVQPVASCGDAKIFACSGHGVQTVPAVLCIMHLEVVGVACR